MFENKRDTVDQLLQERIVKQREIEAQKAELRAIEQRIFRALVESSTGPGYVDWISLMANPQSCSSACVGTSE
jgi:hypothetical protein